MDVSVSLLREGFREVVMVVVPSKSRRRCAIGDSGRGVVGVVVELLAPLDIRTGPESISRRFRCDDDDEADARETLERCSRNSLEELVGGVFWLGGGTWSSGDDCRAGEKRVVLAGCGECRAEGM